MLTVEKGDMAVVQPLLYAGTALLVDARDEHSHVAEQYITLQPQ
jgi:hypothetical protein